jgi:glutamate-1-semialdehyde 2,1-aminomutase
MSMTFDESERLRPRFRTTIPGGSHTYAKGDDQFPEFAPFLVRGKGCHVWDVDGNEFIEYGMGLRAVTLGHAYAPVVEVAYRQMQNGSNFIRPARIELEAAEELLGIVQGAEMAKFAKNGSDVNTAAVRLSRAYTGRSRVAVCGDHPFFAVDDWFIGTTPMDAGIPDVVSDLTVKFHYNDIESVKSMFDEHAGEIACLMMEPEKEIPPAHDFLAEVQRLCRDHGTVFVLDEMITGFRWHLGGGQAYHNIIPDLSTFGKALGNGFSISALVGKREIMKLGGFDHHGERVFLLSTTHGAEYSSLAAAIETMRIYRREPVIQYLWRQGDRLAAGIRKAASEYHLEDYIPVLGRACCLVYGSRDQDKQPSQPFRTLLMQELIRRGILATSLVVSYSHTDGDIDKTIDAFQGAMSVYRKALDEGIDKYLEGRPVKPVFRKYG